MNRIISRAVTKVVDRAVYRTVYLAVDRVVGSAVYWAVHRAVDDAVKQPQSPRIKAEVNSIVNELRPSFISRLRRLIGR